MLIIICVLHTLTLLGLYCLIFIPKLFFTYSLIIMGVFLSNGLFHAIYFYGMFASKSNLFLKSIKGKEFFCNQAAVLFRFDDGPHPIYTLQILEILKIEGIQGLFAITGENAEKYPEIVARIHREGHLIANHTYSHPYNILFWSYQKLSNEIIHTNEIIKNITGVEPKYFCSPMGHKNPTIGRVIKNLGLISVMWDIRTFDTAASFDKIMKIIKRELKPSSIIMFHDAIAKWTKNERDSTILALKETIRICKEKGYLLDFRVQ